jgi:hypothetical protein
MNNLKKCVLLCVCMTSSSLIALTQGVKISSSAGNPDPSSLFEVESTTQGILIPRMSNGEKQAIPDPAHALLVFDATEDNFSFFDQNSSSWIALTPNNWSLQGNGGTNPASQFIGTTDSTNFVIRSHNQSRIRVAGSGLVGVGTPGDPESELELIGRMDLADASGSERVRLYYEGFEQDPVTTSFTNFRIDVNPTSPDQNATVRVFRSTNTTGFKSMLFFRGNNTTQTSASIGVDGANSYFQIHGGGVGIGTSTVNYRLTLPNTASVDGRGIANSWTTYSDQRVKTLFQPIENALVIVSQLQPYSYRHHSSQWVKGHLEVLEESSPSLGFRAQEVYEVLPEAVHKPENEGSELWGMNYDLLIPLLTKAIQEQQEMIEQLQSVNTGLNARIAAVEREMARGKLIGEAAEASGR